MIENSSTMDTLPEATLPPLPDGLYWHIAERQVEIRSSDWSNWSYWRLIKSSHKKLSNVYIESYKQYNHAPRQLGVSGIVDRSKLEIKTTKGYKYTIWEKIFMPSEFKSNYFLMARYSWSEILARVAPAATEANPEAYVNKSNLKELAKKACAQWTENKGNSALYGDYFQE